MPVMQTSDLTPRQYWDEVKANPNRAKFGFGEKAAIINIDCQRAGRLFMIMLNKDLLV